jgi:hypothetical protein
MVDVHERDAADPCRSRADEKLALRAPEQPTGADSEHDRHLARDCLHECRTELTNDLAHIGQPHHLRAVRHDLGCGTQAVPGFGRQVDPQADLLAQLGRDRQHRRAGEIMQQVGTDKDGRPRLRVAA